MQLQLQHLASEVTNTSRGAATTLSHAPSVCCCSNVSEECIRERCLFKHSKQFVQDFWQDQFENIDGEKPDKELKELKSVPAGSFVELLEDVRDTAQSLVQLLFSDQQAGSFSVEVVLARYEVRRVGGRLFFPEKGEDNEATLSVPHAQGCSHLVSVAHLARQLLEIRRGRV